MPRAPDFDGDESRGSTVEKATGKGYSIMTKKARNWLITQNRPEKYGLDTSRDAILKLLHPLIMKERISYIGHSRERYIQSEQNSSDARHDHILLRFPNQALGSQVHQYFPHAALQPCQENLLSVIKYIKKDTSGYWYKVHPEKLGERLPDGEGDFWEWGDVPAEPSATSKKDSGKADNLNALIIASILEGQSDAEIMLRYPYAWRRPSELRKTRFQLLSRKYRSIYRELTTIYIRANMPPKQLHSLYPADQNTYVVSDYSHPWDSYCAEDIVVLLDYIGQFPWPELRRLMSGNYCTLSARFSDAVACYHTLIIVSPLSPSDLQSCKTYESSNIVDYLTHIRTYSDLDDLGADYIRDTDTGAWRRQYLLPPAK